MDYRGNPFFLQQEEIAWIEETLSGMTVEEKIGQLFCLNEQEFFEAGIDDIYRLFSPGAVAYRTASVETLVRTTEAYQKRSKIPLLIAANLESGGTTIVGGTRLGSPMAVGATGQEEMARKLGIVCAREGKSVGINWDFGPVVDLAVQAENPIVQTRAFSADAAVVARLGPACVRTIQEHGMAACIKHFPGDGRDTRDQHLHPTVNDCSWQEWERSYGRIYRACIDSGALTCMAGHIAFPAYLQEENRERSMEDCLPASLSKTLLQGLLRTRLGFNGLITTDSSLMGGFTQTMPRETALPFAIAAGCDMLLFLQNPEEDFEAMKAGLKNGILTEDRLEEAVKRILALKCALGLHRGREPISVADAKEIIGCEEHIRWAKCVADRAITLVKEEKNVLPLDPVGKKRVLLIPVENRVIRGEAELSAALLQVLTGLRREGMAVRVLDEAMSEEPAIHSEAFYRENFDVLLYIACLEPKVGRTTNRIHWMTKSRVDCPHHIHTVPTVFISLGNPYHLEDVPRVKTYINTYASNPETIDLLIEKLMGRSTFKGKSPVDAFCGRWDTRR